MLLRKMSEEVKATAVYSLIILLGFILSCVVYFTVSDVEETTKALVEKQMPALSLIRQTMASVSEQERVLYEYYATTEETLYWESYAAAKNDTFTHTNTLSSLIADKSMIFELRNGLKMIDDAASAFQVNMISNNTSWDLARKQLFDISLKRREIIKLLVVLEQSTEVDVTTGYQNTLIKLTNTNTTIIIYSLAIIFVALVTGWYMRVYFRVSRSNKRLAQFTQRNPHPIVSLNQYNDIIYSNPAAKKMLAAHQDSELKEEDLIPQSFLQQSFETRKQTEFVRIEHALANLSLSCEIHWLSDLNVFDVHISDITEEKKAKKKLNFQAFHCPETALQNGYKLSQMLDYKVQQDDAFSLGLLEMRDYNHFVAGHGVESTRELIRCMASRLHNTVSESDHDIELFKLSEKSFAFIIEADMLEEQIKVFCRQVEKEMEESLYTDFG
ncbi:MAG: GGDEF domain-containing protein, partial [Algicola sp.]|nr:GGDEF domain-containing protein [Algicola sp.]